MRYFLAWQEPAPHAPSLPGFFFDVVGVAPGLFEGAAPGLALVSVAGGGGVVAPVAGADDPIIGCEGDPGVVGVLPGVAPGVVIVEPGAVPVAPGAEVSAAGVMVVPAGSAGVVVVVVAGVAGSGAEPPQAATPSAAAANPKILSRSVISIAFPPSQFELRVGP